MSQPSRLLAARFRMEMERALDAAIRAGVDPRAEYLRIVEQLQKSSCDRVSELPSRRLAPVPGHREQGLYCGGSIGMVAV